MGVDVSNLLVFWSINLSHVVVLLLFYLTLLFYRFSIFVQEVVGEVRVELILVSLATSEGSRLGGNDGVHFVHVKHLLGHHGL